MFEAIIALGIAIPSVIAIYVIYRRCSKRLKTEQDENTTLKTNIQNEAQKTFEEWKNTQLNSLQNQYNSQVETLQRQTTSQIESIKAESSAQVEENKRQTMDALKTQFEADFQQWKQDEETKIRADAIERSQSVIRGHVTEQLAPYLPEFDLNPKDARFVGSPIDFIVFDGLSEGELKRIVIIEVKSGKSQVNKRERQVREIVKNNRIEYREMRIENNKINKKN